MSGLRKARFEVRNVTAPALKLVKAAVLYANEHRDVQRHTMSTEKLCQLAGLPTVNNLELSRLLGEARKVLGDTEDASWPVFRDIWMDTLYVSFEICNRTFDESLLRKLSMQPSQFSQP